MVLRLVGETERTRDNGASLRLTAAALRLGGFTVRELSDSAMANYETTRDFVARRRSSGILVPVDEDGIAAFCQGEENAPLGRPPQRYRISDDQMSVTENRLKAVRGSLASVTRATTDQMTGLEDEMGPLTILERAVRALACAEEHSDDNRQARIADIEILRDAAERDVEALSTRGADAHRILRFGRRLGAVTAQYEELKQPQTAFPPVGAPSTNLLDWLIKRFGWFVGAPMPSALARGALLASAAWGMAIGYVIEAGKNSTTPLEAGTFATLNVPGSPIKIKYLGGSYSVPGRQLVAEFKITNESKEPLRIGEFANAAGQRFLNPDVPTQKLEYPDYLLADKGLSLSDNAPLQPGETKNIKVTVKDPRSDADRLSGLAYDVDSSFAGLLFFYAPTGARYPVEIGGPVIPTFMPV